MRKDVIKDVTLGADPEMFLYSDKLDKFVPVCGLVGGTKEEPLAITDKGHAVQEDNVMVEYCIPPCKTVEEFIDNIIFTKNYINDTILNKLELTSKCVASAMFEEEDLKAPQALHFGCDPDYNAWTYQQNKVGKGNPLMRTAGGHIHIGYKNCNTDTSLDLIRAMDIFLGVPSILLDTDTLRREVYGKAGAYRLKQYGVEYRVLSTFWTENARLMDWAFNATLQAIEFVNAGGIITNPVDIVECINTSNKMLAEEILEDYNIELPNVAIKLVANNFEEN